MERFKAIVSRFWVSLTVIICLGILITSLFLMNGFLEAQFQGNSTIAGLIVGAIMASLIVTFMMCVITSGRMEDVIRRNYDLKQQAYTNELQVQDLTKQNKGLEAELKAARKELGQVQQDDNVKAEVIHKLLNEADELKTKIKDQSETLTESKTFIETVRDMGLNNLKICGEIPGKEPVMTNVKDLTKII
jgi:predicted nuclease with TOPRIM domain